MIIFCWCVYTNESLSHSPSIRRNSVQTQVIRLVLVLVLVMLSVGGCATTTAPTESVRQATFQYHMMSDASAQSGVTVAYVEPAFVGDGELYWEMNKKDEVVTGMVRAFRGSVVPLLTDKGFSVTGPFSSVEEMTFPEKKGAHLLLHMTFDLADAYQIQNQRVERENTLLYGTVTVSVCDVLIGPAGQVQLLAIEPMTSQKLWVKRIEVAAAKQRFEGRGEVCAMQAVTPEIRNAWVDAHEAMFQTVMSSLDRYVNAEEFSMLKAQAEELKGMKAY